MGLYRTLYGNRIVIYNIIIKRVPSALVDEKYIMLISLRWSSVSCFLFILYISAPDKKKIYI